MTYYPGFLSTNSLGEKTLITNLENNMKLFLDWGFLNIGGFTNVNRPTTNLHNFNLHVLRPTKDQTRSPFTTWQSPRKDWVYESGVCFENNSPVQFSGVYVNNSFYPAPTGNANLGYKVDYPNGQIVFNTTVPGNSTVEASYSYRSVQVYKSHEYPQWKELQFDTDLNKANQFGKYDKGDFALSAEHRAQLPLVIIETDSRSRSRPFRLGDRSLIIEQDILCHIISDNKVERDSITDILRLQEDRHIWLFDTNKVIKDKVYQLNLDGSLNASGINYNDLVKNPRYRWKISRISKVDISNITFYHMNLFGSTVRITHEIIYQDFVNACGVTDSSSSESAGQTSNISSISSSSNISEPSDVGSASDTGSSSDIGGTSEGPGSSMEGSEAISSSSASDYNELCYGNIYTVFFCESSGSSETNQCYGNAFTVTLNC
jgi:hypothetical protein